MDLKAFFYEQYRNECALYQPDQLRKLQESGVMDTPSQQEEAWKTLRLSFSIGLLAALLGGASILEGQFSKNDLLEVSEQAHGQR